MNTRGPFRRIFIDDIAIDLGTVNTVIYRRDEGILVNEPTVLAYSKTTGAILAIGREARAMAGKVPPGIDVIAPLQHGVIAESEMTIRLLVGLVHKLRPSPLCRPRIVIAIPVGSTIVERRAVIESAGRLNARRIFLIEEPLAAALGVGIDVAEPAGNLLADIGGGTTEIAVISLDGIVLTESLRVAGNALDQAIIDHLKEEQNLLIGSGMAEQVKKAIGTAVPGKKVSITVKGRDIMSGLPKKITVSSEQVRAYLEPTVDSIIHAIQSACERIPPELSADILDRGLILTGGGALLNQLDACIRQKIGLPVHVAEDPLFAVVRGAGKVLEDLRTYRHLLIEHA